jgi:hypothetical protein
LSIHLTRFISFSCLSSPLSPLLPPTLI